MPTHVYIGLECGWKCGFEWLEVWAALGLLVEAKKEQMYIVSKVIALVKHGDHNNDGWSYAYILLFIYEVCVFI